jgi:hypothetical protein
LVGRAESGDREAVLHHVADGVMQKHDVRVAVRIEAVEILVKGWQPVGPLDLEHIGRRRIEHTEPGQQQVPRTLAKTSLQHIGQPAIHTFT